MKGTHSGSFFMSEDKNIYKVLNENLNNLKENIQLSLI